MVFFWRIRYLDSDDRAFKDRDVWLETNSLDPVTKAAVEMIRELKDNGQERDIVRYRHHFREKEQTSQDWHLAPAGERSEGEFFHKGLFRGRTRTRVNAGANGLCVNGRSPICPLASGSHEE